MRSAAEGLEPADRDQKQLVKTALILVAMMIFGGVAVLAAYIKRVETQQDNFRPAFANELKGHMMLQLADGSVTNTSEIKDDVWIYYQTSFDERDQHLEREKALAMLPEKGVWQVEFFVDMDPNSEADQAQMATLTSEPGVWKVAAKAKVLEKYLKSGLRFGTVPHLKDGEWVYDSSVAVIKRDHPEGKNPRVHIRGEMFDFERAAREAQKEGDESLATGYREEWFMKTINHLLTEGDPTIENE